MGQQLLRESLSDQIQGLAQLENSTGMICLSVVPHIPYAPITGPERRAGAEPAQTRRIISIDEPRSRGAEAYRTLRNSILLSSIDRQAKMIVVTSSLPGEGKSSTSVNYAAVVAQKGGRVLLVDCDLRRPTLNTYFGVTRSNGLSDAILSEDSEFGIITPLPELPNLDFLPAGQVVSLPSEALGSL